MIKRNKIRLHAATLAGIICISLTGCASNKKVDDLEKRVAYLESKLAMSYPFQSEVASTTVRGDASATTMNNATDQPFYYLDNMTAKEIADKFRYYYQNPPYQGETFDEYYTTFPVKPFITQDTYTSMYSSTILSQWVEMAGHGRRKSELDPGRTVDKIDRNAILSIMIQGAYVQMDGTIGYSGEYYSLDMRMFIKDYDTASAVYDDLFQWIPQNCGYLIQENGRGANQWYVYAEYPHPNNISERSQILRMSKSFGNPRESGYDQKIDGYVVEISCIGKLKNSKS